MRRLRSNTAARRNNALEVVVRERRNDPEFLARLLSSGVRGHIRNVTTNYLIRLRNRAARQVSERLRHMWNVVSTSRRNRALIPHAIRIPNLTHRQRLTLAELQNFSNTGIRPLVNRLRRSPTTGTYINPNVPGSRYRLTNAGNLFSIIHGFGGANAGEFKIASGVRRRGTNRLEY